MFKETDVIFSYTRAQAIADGVLVDVTETARECGFKYPVALTARVWAEVVVPDEKGRAAGQSEAGRLWDLLWMLFVAIKRSAGGQDMLLYDLIVSDGERQRTVTLKSVCGPGDDGGPVLTIMMPGED